MITESERLDFINENLSLIQKKNGLTFGTDAYLLSAFVNGKKLKICDLGAGTGVVSLLCLSKGKSDEAIMVEIQTGFAELCERNASINRFSDKVTVIAKNVSELTVADTGGEVDAVVSNPPYMKFDSGKACTDDIKTIARHEIFGGIDAFSAAASKVLKTGGEFYVVFRPERLCDLFYSMRKNNLEPKVFAFVHPRLSASPSLVLVKAKKGAKPGIKIYPPLIIYDNDGKYTPEFAKIYEDCSFEHLKI